jgi:hypothetical protein
LLDPAISTLSLPVFHLHMSAIQASSSIAAALTHEQMTSREDVPLHLIARKMALWICASVLYLQLLSLAKALDSRPLTVMPFVVLLLWLVWSFRRGWTRVGWDMLLALALIGVVVLPNALLPPNGFDVWAYHLPYVVHWMKLGWAAPYYSAGSGPVGYYPGNLELLGVSLCCLTNSTYLFNVLNLISLVLLIVVAAALAQRLKIRPSFAVLIFTGVLLTSKVTRRNLGNAYNDIFLAALIVAALYFMEQGRQNRRIIDIILSALLMGVALGTRYSAVLYGALFVLYGAFRLRSESLALVIVTMALPCAYWYLRNLAITGTPLYPQGLTLAGLTIFPGPRTANPDMILVNHLLDSKYLLHLASAFFTNGHLLLLPFAILVPLRHFRRSELLPIWVAALLCFGLYVTTPLSAESLDHIYLNFRYALPFVCLMITAGTLAVLAKYPFPAASQWLDGHAVRVPRLGVIALAAIIFASGYPFYQSGHAARLVRLSREWGHSWAFVDSLPPSRIAYAGLNTPGMLYGRRLQHDVVYVNVNRRNGGNYHAYPNADIQMEPDVAAWQDNLKQAGVDYLWLCRDRPSLESDWVSEHPADFSSVYEDDHVRIFRVLLHEQLNHAM